MLEKPPTVNFCKRTSGSTTILLRQIQDTVGGGRTKDQGELEERQKQETQEGGLPWMLLQARLCMETMERLMGW